MKKFLKVLKRICFFVLGLFAVVIIALIVILSFGMTLSLDSFRPSVEEAVSSALDRDVHINGSISVKASLSPVLEIRDVQIDNPEGWSDAVFASIGTARIQIRGLPLLDKKIDIGEFTAQQMTLNLHADEEGNNNWQFGPPTVEVEQEVQTPQPQTRSTEPSAFGLQALDTLNIENLKFSYRDDSVDSTFVFNLDELKGSAAQGQPLTLSGEGRIQEIPYSFSIDAGALDQFRLRQQLYPLSLEGQIAGSPFTAQGNLGTDKGQPMLDLNCSLSRVNIGAVLEWMEVEDEAEIHTDHLALELTLRGDNLEKLLSQSNMTFSLTGGNWSLYRVRDGSGLEIGIDKGRILIQPDTPLTIDVDGRISQTPINIKVQGTELINYVQNPQDLPIFITADTAETTLDFKGSMAVPLVKKDVSLELTVKGEQLDSLNDLLNLDLPPIGPYKMNAQMAMSPEKIDLSNLQLNVGSSDLSGIMSLRMDGDKPNIKTSLSSSMLQIDDFAPGEWNLEGNTDSDQEPTIDDVVDMGDSAIHRNEEIVALLSPEALNHADVQILINVDSVMLGEEKAGRGSLDMALQDGRFCIEPLEMELANGTARMEFSFYPTEESAEIHFTVNVEGLDLGVLARRAKPNSKMGGQLNLDVRLDSTAPELSQLMANGSGYFDLGFSPENFDAGIIDLWALSLVSLLTTELDKESGSTINCLVASFDMDQGLMQDRVIFMDTTRMSIEATAVIDFKAETIEVKARPRAKKPQFFSLAIPIQVKGTFDDFGFGIRPVHLVTTMGSFLTSPFHVPLRWLFGSEIPADGVDACRIAWERRKQVTPQ